MKTWPRQTWKPLLLLTTLALASGVGRERAEAAGRRNPGNPYLKPAQKLFADLEYEECLALLAKANAYKGTSQDELVKIGMLEGVAAGELKQDLRATRAFKRALSLDADAKPPVRLSPHVSTLLRHAREELGQAVMPAPAPTPPPAEVAATPSVSATPEPTPPPPLPVAAPAPASPSTAEGAAPSPATAHNPRGPRLPLAVWGGTDWLGRSYGGGATVGFGISDLEIRARVVAGRVLGAGLEVGYAPHLGIVVPEIRARGSAYFAASVYGGGPVVGIRFLLTPQLSLGVEAAYEFLSVPANSGYRNRQLTTLGALQYDLPL